MLKNEDILEEFKKSLTATTKSISNNNLVEISFTKENSSIQGNLINLTEPNIESIKNNLTYIRAEADSLALEFRFHSKEIHDDLINNSEFSNEIFNALEQSRIEAKGSVFFKGIKSNITNKHILDLKKNSHNDQINIAEAFKYVAYEKFLNGANLVQLYTGMVYRGPNIVSKISEELTNILEKKGVKNISEVIGNKE